MYTYKGFSSYQYQSNGTFIITDVECVKVDILRHLFTRRRERVRMPTWGTRIPDTIFEPLDAITMQIVEEDVRAVIRFDPRVELLSLVLTPVYDSNTLYVAIDLRYKELNVVDRMELNILYDVQR